MQISSRFSVAVHILMLSSAPEPKVKTSEYLARSVNTNPALIRKISGMLKRAGLITVAAGSGGASLVKSPAEITLLQVFKAVQPVKNGVLFNIHDNPNPDCLIGKQIQNILDHRLGEAQKAMEQELEKQTILDLIQEAVQ